MGLRTPLTVRSRTWLTSSRDDLSSAWFGAGPSGASGPASTGGVPVPGGARSARRVSGRGGSGAVRDHATVLYSWRKRFEAEGMPPPGRSFAPAEVEPVADRSTDRGADLPAAPGASRWGEVFGDVAAAAAMIDRLVHHAEVISLKGDSYRLKYRDLGRVPAAANNDD